MKFNSDSSKTLWDILLKNTDVKLLVTQEEMSLGYMPGVNICPKIWGQPSLQLNVLIFQPPRARCNKWPISTTDCTIWCSAMWSPQVCGFWVVPASDQRHNVQKILHFHWAALPVPVDGGEDVACIIDGIASHRRPWVTVPEMSSQAPWNKKATRVTGVPRNAYSLFQTAHSANMHIWRRAGEEMDVEH